MRKCLFSSFSAREPAPNCRGGCCRSPPFRKGFHILVQLMT